MCLPTDSWLVGALDVTRWNVNDEGEFDPTDCCSEVADELIPAGASAFVIPADSLSVKKKIHSCTRKLYSAGVCKINLQNI